MYVEPFGLKTGNAVGDNLKALADGIEIVEPFFQVQISEVIGTELVAQEGAKLLVLFQERVFEIGAENVMSVFDAFE